MIAVSVLVTFYNQEKYVDHTLNSIMSQITDFEYEILIGDDGSNDRTVELINQWIEKYPEQIRLFARSRDDGVCVPGFRASRNRLNLLQHVNGKYFIFLDGDDYFSDNSKLQKQFDILEKEENSDCVACSHYIEALYPDGTKITLPEMALHEGKYDLKSYWPDIYFHTDTSLIRSSSISQIPFEYVINNYNDNAITFLALRAGKIYFLPEKMAIYYQTGDGIWTGQRAVKNHIRNLFLVDICYKLEPGLKKETEIRFAKSWEYLFTHRRDISGEEMKPFIAEAEERNLEYSALFLRYNELPLKKKAKLTFRMLSVFVRHCRNKIRKLV